ncbi:glycosyltransferase family 4 protein [Pyrinomonas methylaliphatogenes]|uniref:Glycosyltransferase n=1 Tax=Pyrinomonas methylaliphatogenes TaxID=454194 RepID=A0A0B6WVJ5_9BACT|nr:glycosyltransferase family 4 protein [Pyrinomonas methylaliphatogenes]CDM65086.1 glycosyltransferase [Pyrinomonas methylaliphatogenes]
MNIVFFSPYFGRTGSEVALYNIINHLTDWPGELVVVSGEEGDLLNELPQGIKRHVRTPRRSYLKLYNKIFKHLTGLDRFLMSVARKYRNYIWYINTIVQPDVLRHAQLLRIPCILHCHELEKVFFSLSEEDMCRLIGYPRLIIACSRAVEERLRTLGRSSNLEVLYESIDVGKIRYSVERSNSLKKELGIDDDTFVWAMAGTIDPNKNAVLFVDLAHEVASKGWKVHFLWIGDSRTGYKMFVKNRAEKLGVKISWVGSRSHDYYDYLNVADGFVLTSNADSFPLVMLEAAALSKPIVAFNSGGVREFVKPGMGLIVDSWNVNDLVDAMLEVMTGKVKIDKVVLRKQAERFDVSVQVELWRRTVTRYFS